MRAATLSEVTPRGPRSPGNLAPWLAAVAMSCGSSDRAGPDERLEWTPIGELAIEALVPTQAPIAALSESAGFPTATIGEVAKIFVTRENETFWRVDLASSKAWIQRDPSEFQSFSREEASADEFHLEYSFVSLLDGAPIYGLTTRRRVGGELFDCAGRTRIEAERAAMAATCASLRPARSAPRRTEARP